MFGLSLFGFQAFQMGSEVLNSPAKREHSHCFFTQSALQIFELAKNFAELALHRKRTCGALFAACDGYVVEAFSGLREEERVRIFQRETARNVGTGNDVAVAKLGQNHLE